LLAEKWWVEREKEREEEKLIKRIPNREGDKGRVFFAVAMGFPGCGAVQLKKKRK